MIPNPLHLLLIINKDTEITVKNILSDLHRRQENWRKVMKEDGSESLYSLLHEWREKKITLSLVLLHCLYCIETIGTKTVTALKKFNQNTWHKNDPVSICIVIRLNGKENRVHMSLTQDGIVLKMWPYSKSSHIGWTRKNTPLVRLYLRLESPNHNNIIYLKFSHIRRSHSFVYEV